MRKLPRRGETGPQGVVSQGRPVAHSFRPLSRAPIASAVNHSQYDDAFASTGHWLDCICDDVGKSANGFLVSSRYAPGSPSGHTPQTFASGVYLLKSSPRGGRIVRGDIRNRRIQVIERAFRPCNVAHALAFEARAAVARKRCIACLCVTIRPACMSSIPRLMPSIMASSRSTKPAIASLARNDLVRRVRSASRPSRFFTSGEIRTVSVVLFIVHKIAHCHRVIQLTADRPADAGRAPGSSAALPAHACRSAWSRYPRAPARFAPSASRRRSATDGSRRRDAARAG